MADLTLLGVGEVRPRAKAAMVLASGTAFAAAERLWNQIEWEWA